MEITITNIKNILTRSTGYLTTVTSHSVQPYRGCSFGNALCGVGCYVRHNIYVTNGRKWGSFLEIRENAAESYLQNVEKERRWAQRAGHRFSIFLASSTDPFLPQEFQYGITRKLLEAMIKNPPEMLILQTHTHKVTEYMEIYQKLKDLCELRVHISVETDREKIEGLPPHASPIKKRLEAAKMLKDSGIYTVITVAPLLPIKDPKKFFACIAECADAVVIDHFIQGDGSKNGQRTLKTVLPSAMANISPDSVTLAYRDAMVQLAKNYLSRVGVNIDGFAGRYL